MRDTAIVTMVIGPIDPAGLIADDKRIGPRRCTGAATSRSDLLESRRPLMQAWADYLTA